MILTVTPNPCVDKTLFTGPVQLGAKIRAPRWTCIAGGKGCNVSRAVKVMGGDTAAMVLAGGPTGRHVVDMLEEVDGIPVIPVPVDGLTRTITTVLEEPLHRQTAFFEPGPQVNETEYQRFIDLFRNAVSEATLVTLNGSAPDPDLDGLYRELIEIATAAGVRVILDAYGPIFAAALEARPYMVKPNVEELEQLVGRSIHSREEQWQTMAWLHDQGIELVVLSLGAEGALVLSDREQFHVRPPEITEINPVGSGDSLVAGFALGLTTDMDLETMAILGVAMGTANALSWDIASFTREEVVSLLPHINVVRRNDD